MTAPDFRIVKRTYGDGEVTFMVQRYVESTDERGAGWDDDGGFYTEGEARHYIDKTLGRIAAKSFIEEVLP